MGSKVGERPQHGDSRLGSHMIKIEMPDLICVTFTVTVFHYLCVVSRRVARPRSKHLFLQSFLT